jgi:hypothetical protein
MLQDLAGLPSNFGHELKDTGRAQPFSSLNSRTKRRIHKRQMGLEF